MSHVSPTTSPIAHDVLSRLKDAEGSQLGAIVLRGHLIAVDECGRPVTTTVTVVVGEGDDAREEKFEVPDDENTEHWRLYDDSFTRFVQFKRDDLLHHQPGDQTDQCCATGIVWIRYEAVISEGRTGEAYSLGGSGDGGWHKTGGGWHKTGGGWHKTGGGWGDDPGDWHKTGGGWHPTGGGSADVTPRYAPSPRSRSRSSGVRARSARVRATRSTSATVPHTSQGDTVITPPLPALTTWPSRPKSALKAAVS